MTIFTKLKCLFKDGFFGIVFASTIRKILAFCSGIIVVRILTKSDYGNYAYVINIVNIALMLDGLGTVTGILQFGCEYSENKNTKNQIIRYGTITGALFNVLITIFIVLFGLFLANEIDNRIVLFLFAATIPIPNYLVECFATIFRVERKNKKYSYFSILSSLIVYGLLLVGALLYSTEGAILFRTIGLFLTIFVSFLFLHEIRNAYKKTNNDHIEQRVKKEFLKFSIFSCFNNSVALLFYNADLFLIGEMIFDSDIIAAYKVATTIPLGLTFITSSIVIYVYPKFVAHRFDYDWLKRSYIKLVILVFIINASLALVSFIIAPYLIGFIFGEQYIAQSTPVFKILIIGFVISASFRIPAGNVLDMLHLVKKNLLISCICALFNIVVDVLLIYFWGYIGAAIATVSIYLLYAVLSNLAIFKYISNNNTMNQQIDNTDE